MPNTMQDQKWEESEEGELTRIIERIDHKTTESGVNLETFRAIFESPKEITSFRIKESEQTTRQEFVLRSGASGDLELVKNEPDGTEDDSFNIEKREILEVDEFDFYILNDDVILIEGGEDYITHLDDSLAGHVVVPTIAVSNIYETMHEHGLIRSVGSVRFSGLDDYTDPVSISGNIIQSEIHGRLHDRTDSDMDWIMTNVEINGLNISFGVGRDGRFVLYGPMSLPIDEVVDLVWEVFVEFADAIQ